MANKQALAEVIGRDLAAAAQLGPGPALEEAINQLADLDDDRGSRLKQNELRRLAQRLIETLPAVQQQSVLDSLSKHPTFTARALSAYCLPELWGTQEALHTAEHLTRDRSRQIQDHLCHALISLPKEEQAKLSHAWQHSQIAAQRAVAARACLGQPTEHALDMLADLSLDEQQVVRDAVLEAMTNLAERQPDEVFEKLETWIDDPNKHRVWILTRLLSHAPFNQQVTLAVSILEALSEAASGDKDIRRWIVSVLRALARQHGNRAVQQACAAWLNGDDPILADLAAEALRRIA